MARRIISVSIPASVEAGKEFDITVQYTADQDGKMAITYRGSFDGRPDDEPLAAADTSKTFKMVIARYGTSAGCQLELRFGNTWKCLVEVT